MRQITSDEFKAAVAIDPAWATTLTEQTEVTGYCDMTGSKITHLSSLLSFTARNGKGNSADFSGCRNIKVAEGHFAGFVDFSESSIEKIGELTITRPNIMRCAAAFLIVSIYLRLL